MHVEFVKTSQKIIRINLDTCTYRVYIVLTLSLERPVNDYEQTTEALDQLTESLQRECITTRSMIDALEVCRMLNEYSISPLRVAIYAGSASVQLSTADCDAFCAGVPGGNVVKESCSLQQNGQEWRHRSIGWGCLDIKIHCCDMVTS